MEIVKKNILSIVCGVIVIAAVITYFVWVSGSLYPNLEREAAQRKSQYETLSGLLGKSRTLPVTELKTADPVPLPTFPTVRVIEQARRVTNKMKAQEAQILKAAVKLNQRPPLISGLFPTPKDATKLEFRDAYERYYTNIIPQRLRSARPPTVEDIAKAEQKLWVDKYQSRIFTVNGVEANREVVDSEYNTEVANLREKLERETAEKHQVYLDETAVTTSSAVWKAPNPPPDAQIWFAQMALWVQTDLIDSIAALNHRVLSSKFKDPRDHNIINAPVKHVLTLSVPQGAEMYFRIANTADEALAAGMEDFMSSPTGRTSGAVYDVIKWDLVVKMDARYVPALVQELSRGKFITVHKVDTKSVDTTVSRDEGFFYGSAPMVHVTLTGESLMLREWTNTLVPEIVKKDLPGAVIPAAEGEAVADAQ